MKKDFAKELNALITRYIEAVAHRTLLTNCYEKQIPYLGHYNLEIYLEAKPAAGS